MSIRMLGMSLGMSLGIRSHKHGTMTRAEV